MAHSVEELFGQLTLESLITRNLDKCYLRLATDAEIKRLADMIDPAQTTTMHLDRVWLVNIITHGEHGRDSDKHSIHAIAETRATSRVRSVDLEHQRIRTNNSIYAFNEIAVVPPTVNALLWLCAFFWQCGIGDELGVPLAVGD